MLAHDADGAVHLVGQAAEVEGGGDAVLELDDGDLMVADVVVTAEDAAAVGAGLEGFHQALFGLVAGDHRGGPVAHLGQVGLADVEAALVSQGTVQAPGGAAFGGILLPEEGAAAEGRNGLGLAVRQPHQDIHVMAGLLHDDGAGQGAVAPVAADEGMGHVEVAHILRVLDGDDLAQLAGFQDLLDGGEEIGIAQDVADHDLPSIFVGGLLDLQALHGVRGDGLLQQDVVAQFQGPDGLLEVVLIHGGQDQSVGHLTGGEEGFRVGKYHFRGDVEFFGGDGAFFGVDIRHRSDLVAQLAESILCIDHSPLAGAEQCQFHGASSLLRFVA